MVVGCHFAARSVVVAPSTDVPMRLLHSSSACSGRTLLVRGRARAAIVGTCGASPASADHQGRARVQRRGGGPVDASRTTAMPPRSICCPHILPATRRVAATWKIASRECCERSTGSNGHHLRGRILTRSWLAPVLDDPQHRQERALHSRTAGQTSTTYSSAAASTATQTLAGSSWWFSRERSTHADPYASPHRVRWVRAMIPSCMVHFSIGAAYAFGMWTPALTTAVGVVTSSALDWTHSQVLPVFSCSALVLGWVTSQWGGWIERVGPRAAAGLGSLLWSSALLTTATGVHCQSLPLVYAGWGVLGGAGWGLMYLAPIGNLLQWFPDRKGLATGVTLSAFGMGAALAPIPIHALLAYFAVPPDFVGPTGTVLLDTLSDGTQVVSESSSLGVPGTPVVVTTDTDMAKLSHNSSSTANLMPGVYAMSTGSTGAAPALAVMGIACGGLGLAGSRFLTVPHPEWSPATTSPPTTTEPSSTTIPAPSSIATLTTSSLDRRKSNPVTAVTDTPPNPCPPSQDAGLPIDYVTRRTVQFPLLWLSVFGNATGGLALLTSSKLLFTDVWTSIAPSIVTPGLATAYVTALGAGMAGGRLGWSTVSDWIGRKSTYVLFGFGIPVVGMAPALTHLAAAEAAAHIASPTTASAATAVGPMVAAFCGGSVLAVTFYGGVFSVLPAYVADLFGTKNAGAIVGKLLTAFAASAVVGPMGLAYLRSSAEARSIHELIAQVRDPEAFHAAFGCPLDDQSAIQLLVDAKTVTIGRLMELVPDGTLDPTPFLYDTTCYAAAGLMCLSFAANLMIQPIDVDKVLREQQEQKNK